MGVINVVRDEYTQSIISIQGTEEAAFPLTNLLTNQPKDFWRTDDLSANFTTEGSAAYDTVGLLYTNVSDAATWRIRTADNQGQLPSNPVFDTGNMPFWPTADTYEEWDYSHGIYRSPGRIFEDWLRIDVDDPTNPDGVIRAGVLWVGNDKRPARNFGLPMSLWWEIVNGEASVSRDGTVFPREGVSQQTLVFAVENMDASDYKFWQSQYVYHKKSTPALWIPFPQDEAEIGAGAIYGTIREFDLAMTTPRRYSLSASVLGWR